MLPNYPYRDDGILVYNVIKDYVTNVINIYYGTCCIMVCCLIIYVAAANSLTRKDHDPEAVTWEPGKLFRPVCIHEESEWRPVRTLVSVLV